MEINDLHFSDLQIGFSQSIEIEVTQEDVDHFAALSGDISPIHVDEAFARQRGFPGRVAHGLLIGALISGLIGTRLPGSNGVLQSINLEFRRALIPPDRLHITGEIISLSEYTGQVKITVKVTDHQDHLLCVANVKTIVARE